MGTSIPSLLLLLLLFFYAVPYVWCDASYSNVKAMLGKRLSPGVYDPQLRPLLNQSHVIHVNVTFSVMSVEINEPNQQFSANGVLALQWFDELLVWDSSDFGGLNVTSPHPKAIWKPRMFLVNTLDERDPFEDDYSPLYLFHHGQVVWMPGGVLTTYCGLDMTEFPFDQHVCALRFCSMNHLLDSLEFFPLSEGADKSLYIRNEGWILTSTRVDVINDMPETPSSCPRITFTLKRRPVVYVVNYILPFTLLSLLNNCVFLIPVDSGEKISYGITVLLALVLFLSTTSSMLPKAASSLPLLTLYILSQIISAVVVVIFNIVFVFLHYTIEYSETRDGEKLWHPGTLSDRDSSQSLPMATADADTDQHATSVKRPKQEKKLLTLSRLRFIHQYFDKVCFVLFMADWLFFTLFYIISSIYGN